MAVALPRTDVAPYLARLKIAKGKLGVQISCVSSPKSIMLTGLQTQLVTLEQWFISDGVLARRLRVPITYQSEVIEKIVEDYKAAIESLKSGRASAYVPIFSSVTGDVIKSDDMKSTDYWARNMTSPFEFQAALAKILVVSKQSPKNRLGRAGKYSLRVANFLEIEPYSVLQRPVWETLQ